MKIANRFLSGLLAMIVAAITYFHGFWTGHFLDLRATDEYCFDKPLASPPTSSTWLPLRHLCNWDDGTSTDLVPVYVNPILFVCLAATVICMVLAIRAARGELSRRKRNKVDSSRLTEC